MRFGVYNVMQRKQFKNDETDPLSFKVPNMKEILLMGFYQPNEELSRFLYNAQQEFKISIR